MASQISERIHLLVMNKNGMAVGYVSYVDEPDAWDYDEEDRDDLEIEVETSSNVMEALDLCHLSVDEQLSELVKIERLLANGTCKRSCKLVKVTVNQSDVDIDESLLLERRQFEVLRKLSHDDIKLLGLERLACYSKLKYHNVDK